MLPVDATNIVLNATNLNKERQLQMMKISSTIFSKVFTMLYTIILLYLIRSLPTNGLPLASNTDNREVLELVVEKAVNYSLSSFSSSSNLSIILTHKIFEIMQSEGIQISLKEKKCKPQLGTKLKELFHNHLYISNCVSLTKVSLPILHTEHQKEEDVYIVTTNSSCLTSVRMDTQCFPFRQKAFCETSTVVTNLNLGEDYFPRFVSNMQCSGCRHADEDSSCNGCGYKEHRVIYKLLKRVPDLCDETGREVWQVDHVQRWVRAACSCYQLTE